MNTVNQVTMRMEGGAKCFHCGTLKINPGEECYEVWTGRGWVYVAADHKDQADQTKGWEPPSETP